MYTHTHTHTHTHLYHAISDHVYVRCMILYIGLGLAPVPSHEPAESSAPQFAGGANHLQNKKIAI